MEREAILEIGIDPAGRVYVVPRSSRFPLIYREAMEVQWDEERGFLHGPPPPRGKLWPPTRWVEQIQAAAREQGCELEITAETRWVGILRVKD